MWKYGLYFCRCDVLSGSIFICKVCLGYSQVFVIKYKSEKLKIQFSWDQNTG